MAELSTGDNDEYFPDHGLHFQKFSFQLADSHVEGCGLESVYYFSVHGAAVLGASIL